MGVPDDVIGEDPTAPGEVKPTTIGELGGNRHRAAASYCAQQCDVALAFVASQDGDLSVFIRRDDGVIHCRAPMSSGSGFETRHGICCPSRSRRLT